MVVSAHPRVRKAEMIGDDVFGSLVYVACVQLSFFFFVVFLVTDTDKY